MTRPPPTFRDIEAALYNGRLRPWVDAIPGFWSMTAGEQALIAHQYLQPFLPTRDEIDGLQRSPRIIFRSAGRDTLIVHLHLKST